MEQPTVVLFCLDCRTAVAISVLDFRCNVCGERRLEPPEPRTVQEKLLLESWVVVVEEKVPVLEGRLEGVGRDVLWQIVARLDKTDMASLMRTSVHLSTVIGEWKREGRLELLCRFCRLPHSKPLRYHPGTFAETSFLDIATKKRSLFLRESADAAKSALYSVLIQSGGVAMGAVGAAVGGICTLSPLLLAVGAVEFARMVGKGERDPLKAFVPGLTGPALGGYFGYLFVVGEEASGMWDTTRPIVAKPQTTRWTCCDREGSTSRGCIPCEHANGKDLARVTEEGGE